MTEPKLFTLEEAEATLPLVRRVLTELAREYPRWREAMRRYELGVAGLAAGDEEPPELLAQRDAVGAAAERIAACLAELEAVGCLVKGFEDGLVDFYTLRDDRLVLLCYQLGEEHITHWHELDGGFAGRQPIDHHLMTTGHH